jgi:single-stranded DNA-binding protein
MILKQGNNRQFAGRIVRDVEVRQVNTDKGIRSVTSFGIGVGDREIINVTAWGSIADYAGTFRKGDNVQGSGTENPPRKYKDKNGEEKTAIDITLDYIAIQPTLSAVLDKVFAQTKPPAPPPARKGMDADYQEPSDDLPF